MADRETFYFPENDVTVIVERGGFRGLRGYLAFLDSDDEHIKVYGDGDTVLSAIADLNRELELVE
jgi:hypothetical protein